MKTAQIPLIEELSLERIKDSTDSVLSRKFIPPTSTTHALVLLALRSGPQPISQLQRIAGENDSATLLENLRKLGLELLCYEVPELDAEGHVGCRTVCVLTAADVRRVNRWVKTCGGRHA